MSTKSNMLLATVCLLGAVAFSSCEKDDHSHDEEELITTVNVIATEVGGAATTFTFRDTDGPGGMAPSKFDSIILNANKTYSVSIQFLNESVTPAEDITKEIREEDDEHQLYFQPTGVSLTVSGLDTDSKGLPLGLASTWTAGAVGKGSMKVTLKHKPGTKAAGDPVTKGETDVEIDFGVRLR